MKRGTDEPMTSSIRRLVESLALSCKPHCWSGVYLLRISYQNGENAMRLKDIVSKDPNVHSGDLVFAGTRVPVDTLIDYLNGGYSINRFLQGFPSVTRKQVQAFLELGMDQIENLIDESKRERHARVD